MTVCDNNLVGQKAVIANPNPAVCGEDHTDQGRKISNIDCALWSQIEKAAVVDPAQPPNSNGLMA
jgi:hypothetical protein